MDNDAAGAVAEALSAVEVAERVADVLLGRDEWEPCVECDRPVDPRDEVLLGSIVYCRNCYRLEIDLLFRSLK